MPSVHDPLDGKGCELLPRSFFERDPQIVAPDLLGKVLVRRRKDGLVAGRVVEVEAYLEQDDPAAHSAAGRTPRNLVLFGPAGHAYVYFIYGMYFCLNISCMQEGEAGCVLVRALEPLAGIDTMIAARGLEDRASLTARGLRLLTSGPGRLADAFEITRARDNGKDLTSPTSDLLIVDHCFNDSFVADDYGGGRRLQIRKTPRIGITKAAEAPLRYVIDGNMFVSGKPVRPKES